MQREHFSLSPFAKPKSTSSDRSVPHLSYLTERAAMKPSAKRIPYLKNPSYGLIQATAFFVLFSGLLLILRHLLQKFLEIDPKAWSGLEETAISSPAKHHIGAFLSILSEDNNGTSSERDEQELAVMKAVDSMTMSLQDSAVSPATAREKHCEYERECREKTSTSKMQFPEVADAPPETLNPTNSKTTSDTNEALNEPVRSCDDESMVEGILVKYQRKVMILFELLSACVADTPADEKKHSKVRKGYDARDRVALRLLATWFDVKWIQMVCLLKLVS